jgi:hypothetical protein
MTHRMAGVVIRYQSPARSTTMIPWNNTCEALKIAWKENVETFTSNERHLSVEEIWALQNKTYWHSAGVHKTDWCSKKLCLFCVYFMCILCLFCVYFVSILCLFCVHFVSILCLICVYFVSILCLFLSIFCLFCVYFVSILCLFCVYFVSILCLFCV